MKLWNKYKVTSIPSLVFVDAATGKVVCRNGLLVVRDDPKGAVNTQILSYLYDSDLLVDRTVLLFSHNVLNLNPPQQPKQTQMGPWQTASSTCPPLNSRGRGGKIPLLSGVN